MTGHVVVLQQPAAGPFRLQAFGLGGQMVQSAGLQPQLRHVPLPNQHLHAAGRRWLEQRHCYGAPNAKSSNSNADGLGAP